MVLREQPAQRSDPDGIPITVVDGKFIIALIWSTAFANLLILLDKVPSGAIIIANNIINIIFIMEFVR